MKIENTTPNGVSEVGNVTIQYRINKDENGNAVNLNATMYSGLNIIGTANSDKLRVIGISFRENGLTNQERKDVVNQILDDIEETFNETESATSSEE